MRALVLAQGNGDRWGNHLGIPKQLVPLDGEPVVHRAARVFDEAGCEVLVVADDVRFVAGHGRLVTLDDAWPVPSDASKFLATRHLWSTSDRTVMVWGDCWYSPAAVRVIVGHPSDRLHYFRRPWPGECGWDESFAVSFGPDDHERVTETAWRCHRMWEQGIIPNFNGHIPVREHYAAHLGSPPGRWDVLVETPDQTVIDDWTDDIDTPDEYDRWTRRAACAS